MYVKKILNGIILFLQVFSSFFKDKFNAWHHMVESNADNLRGLLNPNIHCGRGKFPVCEKTGWTLWKI
tara:strand:+ start:350 stop:553 length:204 start_codon:yes stop_codon:yes gene_type:complete